MTLYDIFCAHKEDKEKTRMVYHTRNLETG